MRTKTLLLAAAISAAGLATSMAQAVYSVNMVGYINLSVPPGYSMIANQLQGASTQVSALFTAPPEGTTVYKFNGAGYDIAQFVDGVWEGVAVSLAPGEGAFMFNPAGTPYVPTLVGEVVLTSSNPLPGGPSGGYSVRSSVIPQQAPIQSVLNFPAGEGDTIYRFAGGGYDISSFIDGAWEPAEAQPRVGESFFVFNAGATKNWTRTFPVGP
jgi:hypothetical protein